MAPRARGGRQGDSSEYFLLACSGGRVMKPVVVAVGRQQAWELMESGSGQGSLCHVTSENQPPARHPPGPGSCYGLAGS